MVASADIRGIAVRLLKTHRLRYIDMRTIKDPLTGTGVIVLKFRRDKERSPKAFFDDLNENGIQYKKLVKDPNAVQIVVELWPRGQKHEVSKARDKARDKARSEKNKTNGAGSNGNLDYVRIPSGANLNVITSLAKDLIEAGFDEEADELTRIAGGQDWDEFRRKMGKMFRRLKLHTRPEVRQLKEAIAAAVVKEMAADAALFKGMRSSDLERKFNDSVMEHLDLILDTRGIANSVIRRVASTSESPTNLIVQLKGVKRGLETLASRAQEAEEPEVLAAVMKRVAVVNDDIIALRQGKKASVKTNLDDHFMVLVASRKLDAAFLHLIESND